MPNHVHILIKCTEVLSRIIQSLKSYTGKWGLANNEKLNLGIGEKATAFWMPEYWDRFIRDENHFNDTIEYILNNPRKAQLAEDHAAFEFTGMRI